MYILYGLCYVFICTFITYYSIMLLCAPEAATGKTPLHLACERGHEAVGIVYYLLY